MKAVILAGGYGTRISEESHLRPKPMIEIGGKPILWHIMKIYACHGINDFVVCCGYKAEIIREYFESFDSEKWNIQLVDTGLDTMTGGRIKRIESYLDDTFCLTYGDGVSDIDISKLILFHKDRSFFEFTIDQVLDELNTKVLGLTDKTEDFAEFSIQLNKAQVGPKFGGDLPLLTQLVQNHPVPELLLSIQSTSVYLP